MPVERAQGLIDYVRSVVDDANTVETQHMLEMLNGQVPLELVEVFQQLHWHTVFPVAAEWDYVPGRMNLGRGDLVFCDFRLAATHADYTFGKPSRVGIGPQTVLIVEIKIVSDGSGRNQRVARRKARRYVENQVVASMNAWRTFRPGDSVHGVFCTFQGDTCTVGQRHALPEPEVGLVRAAPFEVLRAQNQPRGRGDEELEQEVGQAAVVGGLLALGAMGMGLRYVAGQYQDYRERERRERERQEQRERERRERERLACLRFHQMCDIFFSLLVTAITFWLWYSGYFSRQ